MNKNNWKKCIRRRILLVLLLLAGSWLLTGFVSLGKSPVELKSDKALIDLGLLVQDSLPGKYGNQESGLSGATEDTSPEGEETSPEEKADAEGTEAGVTPVTRIEVVIRGTDITVNENACKDTADMLEQVRALYRVGLMVYLVDDYADYQVYTEAFRLLREQKFSMIEKQVN